MSEEKGSSMNLRSMGIPLLLVALLVPQEAVTRSL